jgi:hypothetical protein
MYFKIGKDKKMNTDELATLNTILRALRHEQYASAEIVLQALIMEKEKDLYTAPMDSSYPDGDGYWHDTKENVA